MCGIFGCGSQMYAFQQMVDNIAVYPNASYHLVENGGFAHAVDAAEDIDFRIEVSDNVFLATPKSIDFYRFDIVCILLHSLKFYVCHYYVCH